MKIRFLNLLLIGSIVSSVMLSSCSKNDDDNNYNPEGTTDTFTDSRDNKVYKYITIGDQVWMAENLAYTGSGIRRITDDIEWENNMDYDGWSYYDNNVNFRNTYGVLYQFEAAKSACPSGWHLPTDVEWTQLENYLQENGFSYDGVVGNNYIAKSLATDNGWERFEEQGSVGNTDFPDFRNKTGFSALPGGLRISGSYSLTSSGNWWSATEFNINEVYCRSLRSGRLTVSRVYYNKSHGFSVRCVKD